MDILIWNRLPTDMINIILLFDGKIKYRNGKYMNQIKINDYNFLLQIPKPINHNKVYNQNLNYELIVYFSNNKKTLTFDWFMDRDVYKISYVNDERLYETMNIHTYFFYDDFEK
jgi:hypothetical protein